MPSHSLAYMLASRVRTIAWHLKNDLAVGSDPYTRNVDEIERLCKAFMPSGSGFDSGTTLVIDDSKPARLVFQTSFHHMNDAGMYDGWTEHRVYYIAEHDGADLVIGGRDRNGIKDYIAECFNQALGQTIQADWDNEEKEFTFTNQQGWKA